MICPLPSILSEQANKIGPYLILSTVLSLFPLQSQAYELGLALGKSTFFNSKLKLTSPEQSYEINEADYNNKTNVSVRFANWLEKQQRWAWACEANFLQHDMEYQRELEGKTLSTQVEIDYYQLMFNSQYRWFPSLGPLKFEPYVGAGLGLIISDVELKQSTQNSSSLSYTGISAQGLAGIRFPISQKLNLSLDYKIAYIPSDSELNNNNSIELSPWANLMQLGLHYQF